jgi:hypothetical protein
MGLDDSEPDCVNHVTQLLDKVGGKLKEEDGAMVAE